MFSRSSFSLYFVLLGLWGSSRILNILLLTRGNLVNLKWSLPTVQCNFFGPQVSILAILSWYWWNCIPDMHPNYISLHIEVKLFRGDFNKVIRYLKKKWLQKWDTCSHTHILFEYQIEFSAALDGTAYLTKLLNLSTCKNVFISC